MANRIQVRRDTAANWTTANPVLAAGETGLETDTGRRKTGDGTTVWTALPYVFDKTIADGIYTTPAAADAAYAPITGSTNYLAPGQLDAANAANITTPTSATAGALNAAYAPVSGSTFYAKRMGGARTIVLGDSVDAAVNGWFPYLCILSNQAVTYLRNAGIPGQTTTQFLARIQTDVIAYAPDICIIGGATNDHSQGIPEATTRANYKTMVAALLAAGIKPVVRNCPPCDNAATSAPWNTIALRRAVIQRHNTWLSQWANGQGVPVLDLYSTLVDPATGGYLTGLTADGTHPVEQASHDIAVNMIGAGLPSMFNGSVHLATALGEDSNLLYGNNGVFIGDSNADGVADWWNVGSATVKSLSAATAPAKGNVQHLEGATTPSTVIYQDVVSPAASANHTVTMSGRLNLHAGTVTMRLQMTSGTVDIGPFSIPMQGTFYCEALAPSNVTQIRVNVFSTTGTAPSFDVSQVSIRDRTTYAV